LKSVYAIICVTCIAACGGDSSVPGDVLGVVATDASGDAAALFDVPVADTATAEVTGSRADVADVSAHDVMSLPDVGPVTCPVVPAEGGAVTFTQVPRTFPAPTLIGNMQGVSTPTGAWKLAEVTLFQAGTFVDWVTVAFSNAGDTSGNAAFTVDNIFGVHMFVDMKVAVTVGENYGEDSASARIEIGGPVIFDGGAMRGDFTRCGAGMATGGVIPQSMAFDHDGARFRIAVVLSREAIIELLPEAQRENAAFVVTGPLTVVARFQR